jgi:4-hydroxybenzoate polyprenyltransferase
MSKIIMRWILHTFILNRLHIIVSAPAVMWCWSEFLKMRFRSIDYLIITLAVACICQWNRLTDVEEDTMNCPADLKDAQAKSRAIKVFCYAGGTIAVVLAIFTECTWGLAGLVAFGTAVGYFYNSPLLPSQPYLRLKNMFIIKNVSSGAGWSAGLLVFPMLRSHAQPDERFFTAFVYMFAMVMTYEIIWDMRDAAGDAQAGIRTLPVVLGMGSSRVYATLLQFACLGIIISGLANSSLTPVWSLYLLPSIMLLTLIIFFPRLIRYNRDLSHVLVMALTGFACLGGFLAARFG